MALNHSNSNNSGLKAIIVVLILLLLGSLAYIYKIKNESAEIQTNLVSEKAKLQADLEAKIAEYEKAIADNTALKSELEAEQAKMVDLLEKLKKSKGDATSMAKFKLQYFQLKKDMDNLVAENNTLKEKNIRLTKNLDSTNVVLTDAKIKIDTLNNQKTSLVKTVEKGQKLSILNLQTIAVKQKSSGKQVNTDKASRADLLKISFTIAENQIAKKGDRIYYIQVIDSKNNVLGEKKNEAFGSNYLSYSFTKTIQYENKTVIVQEDLPVKNIFGGSYFVNVFDKDGNLVAKSNFSLR
jgi:hypothetical protein